MRTIFANIISVAASVGFTTLAVAASAPAVAATVDTVPHAVVQTADLDLQSASGQQTAMRRLNAAATRVCDSDDRLDAATCRADAMADARRSLDSLTAPERIASR